MSIVQAFLDHSERTPERVCVRFAGESLSYGELRQRALAWAAVLQDQGVARGDRVALFLPNSVTFIAAYLGIQLAGAAAVLVNTQYRQNELRHILNDSGAFVVVSDAHGAAELERITEPRTTNDEPRNEGTTGRQDDFSESRAQNRERRTESAEPRTADGGGWRVIRAAPFAGPEPPIILPKGDEVALLAYTSGTTGRAKGAVLLQRNLAANSAAVTQAWHWTHADCLLLTLPLFHIHGLGVGLHGTLFSGASLVLYEHFDATVALQGAAERR
ncbi:acyl--CoA ligase, partial [Candidatus Gracilibacteria bacterium]|nr:acyl--CoA ligase [Candidatus Gracilibacteria bacterium]